MLTINISTQAMSYEQARREALFLTDKMAYELNLTDSQYDAAYEINLDYLMGVTGRNNVYGTYWERRNIDLGYILLDWQYRAFCEAAYFTVRCIGMQAVGTSEYMHAIHTAHISTSPAQPCTCLIAEDTVGTATEG